METNYSCSHTSDGYGQIYEKTYNQGFYKYQWLLIEKPILEKIFHRLSSENKHKYLDFACGTGRIINVAEKYFNDCTGVDLSDEMIKVAKSKCNHANIIKKDITKETPLIKYDVITAFRFFLNAEHELRCSTLNSIFNSLADNGYFIANIHVNSNSILGYVYRIRNRIMRKNIANTLSYQEFCRYLDDAGFTVSEVYWYSYLPRAGWRLSWFYKVFLLPFENMCVKYHLMPKSMAQSFLVVMQKKNNKLKD